MDKQEIPLTKALPLPLALRGNTLVFGEGMKAVKPDVRTMASMKAVLADPSAAGPEECYYMYRGVCLEKDRALIEDSGLSYDITIIPPLLLGREYNKTFGHFHPEAAAGMTYPELYEVLHGRAHFALQDTGSSRFVVFDATAGDKVLIPPNYGHITINPSEDVLVISNWVCSGFTSDYRLMEEKRGGLYYLTESGWIKNPAYEAHPEIEFRKPSDMPASGLFRAEPMYNLIREAARLSFLKEPSLHKDAFSGLP
jgi:glucose-6-phosphate isomerase